MIKDEIMRPIITTTRKLPVGVKLFKTIYKLYQRLPNVDTNHFPNNETISRQENEDGTKLICQLVIRH
jgi:hypothetical protein